MNGDDTTEGLDSFVEQHRQVLRDVKAAMRDRHGSRLTTREKADVKIHRPSSGGITRPGDFVLAKEVESTLQRSGQGDKVERQRLTRLWEVKNVLRKT